MAFLGVHLKPCANIDIGHKFDKRDVDIMDIIWTKVGHEIL